MTGWREESYNFYITLKIIDLILMVKSLKFRIPTVPVTIN